MDGWMDGSPVQFPARAPTKRETGDKKNYRRVKRKAKFLVENLWVMFPNSSTTTAPGARVGFELVFEDVIASCWAGKASIQRKAWWEAYDRRRQERGRCEATRFGATGDERCPPQWHTGGHRGFLDKREDSK